MSFRIALLDEGLIDLLGILDKIGAVFRINAGLQTINPEASKCIKRNLNKVNFRETFELLRSKVTGNIQIDVMFGLPGDNYVDFKKTLDFVFNLKPDIIVIYRVVVLKGSQMRRDSERLGIIYQKVPPYKVYSTHTFSHSDIIKSEVFRICYYTIMPHFSKNIYSLLERHNLTISDYVEKFFEWLRRRDNCDYRNLLGYNKNDIIKAYFSFQDEIKDFTSFM